MLNTTNLTERFQELKATRKGVSTPSLKQIEMYYRTCEMKGINPQSLEELMNLTGKQMFDLNSEVYAVVGKASESQVDTIRTIITRLQSAGVEIGMPSDEALSRLTGGREGSASKLISALIEREKASKEFLPITEGQIDKIIKMRLCPDVDFTELNVSLKVQLDEKNWRHATNEEIKEQLKGVLKKDASMFLDKYGTAFFEWSKTRISSGQQAMIRTLESRLADIRNPQEKIIDVDQDGNIVERLVGEKEAYVQAYSPLTAEQLLMFSREEAEHHISMLKADLARKFPSQTEKIDVPVRTEDPKLVDAIYSLFAMAGYEDEEVLSSIHEKDNLITDEAPIKRFIQMNLDNDSLTEEFVKNLGLEELLPA